MCPRSPKMALVLGDAASSLRKGFLLVGRMILESATFAALASAHVSQQVDVITWTSIENRIGSQGGA